MKKSLRENPRNVKKIAKRSVACETLNPKVDLFRKWSPLGMIVKHAAGFESQNHRQGE
jgi:hypothetical protein